MSRYRMYPVIVCTQQCDGAPAFHVCTPEVTQAQIDNGDHYDKAIENARSLDYEGSAVAFDLKDPAASQLADLAKMVRQARSGELALEILALDGAVISGSEGGHPLTPRTWAFKSRQGQEMSHVCVAKSDAALMFVTDAYPCGQNDWLRDVQSGTTVDGYLEWTELKLRAIRLALRSMKERKHRIQCVSDPRLFWSNQDGWVEEGEADKFTDDEKASLNLPIEGQWVEAGAASSELTS